MPDRLLVPLHFLTRGRPIWPEILAGDVSTVGPEALRRRCSDGFACWILQTYVLMRQAGLQPSHGPELREGAVNVIHPFFFGLRDRQVRPFLLACRADAHRPWSANFWLEQNGVRGASARHASVPHWPQPGLIPRDPSRGSRIETLVFKGEELNFDVRFRGDAFRQSLADLGVTLRLDLLSEVVQGTGFGWHDYSTTDLVLAARNLSPEDAAGKPASKLVNAWHAGVPALLGPEPAFQELRQSPLDYLEIRTPEDVIAALARLRANPGLFDAMIANGGRRAADYTTGKILAAWLEVLNGPVRDAFLRWERRSLPERAMLVARDLVRDKLAKRAQSRALTIGPRILDTAS